MKGAMGFLFASIVLSCAQTTPRSYPAHWGDSIIDEHAPSWEIFPQAALRGEVILSKRTELSILSNFVATHLAYRGKRYASLEGFWQMMKYPENSQDERFHFILPHTRAEVAAMIGFEAKKAGDQASAEMR